MRTLLMVDRGDGKVRNLTGRRWTQHPSEFWQEEWRVVVDRIADGYPRWWLVEAESADAARRAIECFEGGTGCTSGRVFGFDHCRSGRHPGRILASGGNGGAK